MKEKRTIKLEASATPLDRLKYLVQLSNRSQAQFAKLIGLDPSQMSRLLTGKLKITDQFMNRLVANLGISKRWFSNGEGIPFPRVKEMPETIDAAIAINETYNNEARPVGALVYDVNATAGPEATSNMFARDRVIGSLNFPGFNPEYPIIRVNGESMSPSIPNGAYISLRPLNNTSILEWGNVYVVVLEDYRMVKIVRRCPEDKEKVILHSINPEFDDIIVDRKDILKMFLVEKVINMHEFN